MPLNSAQENFLARANLPVALTDDREQQERIVRTALQLYNVRMGGVDANTEAMSAFMRECAKADG